MSTRSNTQQLTILAQDPAVRDKQGRLILATVDVPKEQLALGPVGYRVKVVDFDATTNKLYTALKYTEDDNGIVIDPFKLPDGTDPHFSEQRAALDARVLSDPNFHAQNVYAIVMRTLARFEYALGRRVAWGFDGHQLHIAPHAFLEANAFYSHEDRSLMFGYFKGKAGQYVFTSLSHDIVAHEATHAILDGLRTGFLEDSGPDQAAFHEGFSDVVALLSVFSLREIVEFALTNGDKELRLKTVSGIRLVDGQFLDADALSNSILFGLGKEFGQQLEGLRANALRRSIQLVPSLTCLQDPEYEEPHARGEILSAALLRSFLKIWLERIKQLGTFGPNMYHLDAVIEAGAKVADHLLTIAIRALDYCPPLDLEFGDYLAALLTVDAEVAPDDSRYGYRDVIQQTFGEYGITSPSGKTDKLGCWNPFTKNQEVHYQRTNFESMLRDKEEVFRFLWENRQVLNIDERAYTQVVSVRPSVRVGPDGFFLKETVCEYTMRANIFASELHTVCGITKRPDGMAATEYMTVYGAGVLVFDQYGQIKFHIQRPLRDTEWQERRINYLWDRGQIGGSSSGNQFAEMHRARAVAHSTHERLAKVGGSKK